MGLMMIMTTATAGPAPAFKLKDPSEYFGAKTIALLGAALAGDEARVRQSVKDGADPNEEGPQRADNRLRPLHYAVAANNLIAVKLLLSAGANPEQDAQGFGNALLFAITLDNAPMLSQMLELRPPATLARPTVTDLLFQSVAMPRPRCLAVLLQRGVPVDLPDAAGNTILMEALAAQDYDMSEWLLQQGAGAVREPTRAGRTPANALQYYLGTVKPGSPSHVRLQRIQQLMQAKGAVFPAPTAQEIRAARGQK
jgi:ankyrin repeat protein